MKARRNIVRMPLRSAVILLIFFTVIMLLISMLSVRAILSENISAAVGPLGGCATVGSDDGAIHINMEDARYISGNFSAIKTYHATADATADAPEMKHFSVSGQSGDEVNGLRFDPLCICAVTSTDIARDFYSGDAVILSGVGIDRVSNDSGKLAAVVPEAFAELNCLSIGDAVTITVGTNMSESRASATVYVCGIYRATVSVDGDAVYDCQLSDNKIYIPMSVYEHMLKGIGVEILPSSLYFEFNRPQRGLAEALGTRLRESGMPGTWNIKLETFIPTDEAAVAKELYGTLDIAIAAMGLCFAAAAGAVLVFNLHTRRREMGTYRAMGFPKRRIALLFLRETMILCTAAFLLAAAAVSLIAALRGGEIYAALSPESLGGAFYETSLDSLMRGDAVKSARAERFADGSYAVFGYVLPALPSAACVILPVIALFYIAARISVRKISVMRDMGGRAEE